MPNAPRYILLVAVAIVAALAGVLLARNVLLQSAPVALSSGTRLQPPRPLAPFALVDQYEVAFDNARLRGRWSWLFFGFANCGDVCPTTLALLATTAKSLGDLPATSRPQIVFVSVDAQRDTPQVLQGYVKNFDPTIIGVTGAQTALDAFTKDLGMPSAIRPLENGSYAVDHSASILAMNPQGELAAVFSAPHTVQALAADYRALIGVKPIGSAR